MNMERLIKSISLHRKIATSSLKFCTPCKKQPDLSRGGTHSKDFLQKIVKNFKNQKKKTTKNKRLKSFVQLFSIVI